MTLVLSWTMLRLGAMLFLVSSAFLLLNARHGWDSVSSQSASSHLTTCMKRRPLAIVLFSCTSSVQTCAHLGHQLPAGEDRTGPGYGKSAGSRIKAADRDTSRRKWGRSNGPELGEWEHGGAQTVENKRGTSGRGSTPGGLITRSTAYSPNPGNFAMRSPRRPQPDPQSKQTHAPLSSPRNQRTNLKGPVHEFKRMSDSKYSAMSPTSTASDFLATTLKKTSPKK